MERAYYIYPFRPPLGIAGDKHRERIGYHGHYTLNGRTCQIV